MDIKRGELMKKEKLIKDCKEKLKAGKRVQLEYIPKENAIRMLVITSKKYGVYDTDIKGGESLEG